MKITVILLIFFICCGLQAQTFTNVAGSLGINHNYNGGFNGGGVTVCDYNNDGLDDIIFSGSGGLKVYKNNNGQFSDVTAQLGLAYFQQCKTVLVADYDNDGDRDMFITTFIGQNRMYKLNGTVYEDITNFCGLYLNDTIHSTAAMFFDFNKDGLLDLYAGTYSGYGNPALYDNRFYKNTGNGMFQDITAFSGCGNYGNKVLALAAVDYNNDGWEDIYIACDRRNGNTMLKNNGNGTFTDVSEPTNTNQQLDAMGLSAGDYDNDGDFDIYVSNGQEGNVFLKNNGNGTFTDVAAQLNMTVNKICWGNNFFDYDNDGDLDLFVSSSGGAPNNRKTLFSNNGNGTFTNITNAGFQTDEFISFGNAIGDYDNNGYYDIAILNDYDPCTLYKNSGGSNKWIKIKLQGTHSNREAVGSIIYVYRNGTSFMRHTFCGNSYNGQNSFVNIIGVGTTNVIDSIAVRFPSGIRNTVYNVSTNQTITIVETGTIGITLNNNEIPERFALEQNYPNPFNPSTVINYSVPKSSDVKITVFDVSGREVTILANSFHTAGNYRLSIDEGTMKGLSSGLYFYRLQAEGYSDVKKMIYIK